MNLPKQDSATGRGIKTGVQAVIGTTVAFVVGLVLAVWNVPGVPEAILNYIQSNFIQVMAVVGVSSGTAGFVWNLFRKNVRNY